MFYDKEFLLQLDKTKNKIIYARITALTFDERPIETIEGRITQGSISVDGSAAVRRTCSLTMVADKFDYQNYYWGINTKFKLEVGVSNFINSLYPDIIWFKQGIYVFTSFNTSRSSSNFTISLQGKDKMCLLNGEVGGSLESSIDFGTIEEESEDGIWQITQIPIYQIIRNMVHTYAGEPYHNIVINDLEDYGLELLEYRYDTPMFLYRPIDSAIFANMLLNGNKSCSVERIDEDGETYVANITLNDLTSNELDMLVDTLTGSSTPKPVTMDGAEYYVAKIEYGQTAGYRLTDLTYAGDLIANIGESITSVLDKIKNMLSEFEYFYDLDGQFIFQRKQSFINTLWTPNSEAETEDVDEDGNSIYYSDTYSESIALASSVTYVFNEGELVTAFNNNPNLLNMRNDFSVWGSRTSVSGAEIPVHLRYAIDTKPSYYKNFKGQIFMTDKSVIEAMKEQAKQEIADKFYDRIKDFKMTYSAPAELAHPIQQEDGSWSAGWWDIRDWYNYYVTLTSQIPSYTMKWYSRNDDSGYMWTSDLAHLDWGYKGQACWLIIKDSNGKYQGGHGSGSPELSGYNCTLYQSYYTDVEAGTYKTEKVLDDEGNAITKYFMQPYSGCSDTHTYIDFLERDVKKNGGAVYFYNPDFPDYDSFEDLIIDQIEKEYEEYEKQGLLNFVDWREIIYQMALDYYQHNTEDDFELQLRENNVDYYPTGRTGYERYYIDLQGFWRQIYNPFLSREKEELQEEIDVALDTLEQKKVELENESDETNQQVLASEISILNQNIADWTVEMEDIDENLTLFYLENDTHPFWHKDVYEYPHAINFWFDFLDAESELSQFNVQNVGSRSKAVNETTVKSIYFRETPDIVFESPGATIQPLSGYKYIQVQDIDSMFSISSQGKSAKDRLDELIYNYGYCIESATITTVPVYYLQPNTRIHIHDQETNLNGDYIISKMTIPLTYNGTMSITATKAAESII